MKHYKSITTKLKKALKFLSVKFLKYCAFMRLLEVMYNQCVGTQICNLSRKKLSYVATVTMNFKTSVD